MKRVFIITFVIIASTALTVGIVSAATQHNVTSTLGGVSGDYFEVDGAIFVDSLKVGEQGVGGVTFFNGTIINQTTDATTGEDKPVTFGDNVRIDGRVYRGATAGTGDAFLFIVNDNMEVVGSITASGGVAIGNNQTVVFGTETTLDVTDATLTGLSSDDLSDGATIANTDVAETLTGDWVSTAYPWSADEISD
ncbi:MAG TPA: hypothetical protein ENI48_05295, partial [Thioploca sp.]|nr:hypothetical protein [Thioploca sp.]